MIWDKAKQYLLEAAMVLAIVIGVVLGLRCVHLTLELASVRTELATTGKAFADYIAEQAAKTGALEKTNRETETRLTESARKTLEAKDHEIQTVRAERDAALERLRNRPSRPAVAASQLPGAAAPAAAESSCTGAQLYREDGEFLVREASISSELRAELIATRALYESARAAQALSQGSN